MLAYHSIYRVFIGQPHSPTFSVSQAPEKANAVVPSVKLVELEGFRRRRDVINVIFRRQVEFFQQYIQYNHYVIANVCTKIKLYVQSNINEEDILYVP